MKTQHNLSAGEQKSFIFAETHVKVMSCVSESTPMHPDISVFCASVLCMHFGKTHTLRAPGRCRYRDGPARVSAGVF